MWQISPEQRELLDLESDLLRAMERNELVLHYQPQADVQTGKVVGAEALVRWHHATGGLRVPAEMACVKPCRW
jgi:sensor c-di-GMP phosphodiesterase-like protein